MKSLKQAILCRGIDEKHAIKLWRRRERYAMQQDRPKRFADSPVPSVYFRADRVTQHEVDLAKMTINLAADTRAYVRAWTILNHLKE